MLLGVVFVLIVPAAATAGGSGTNTTPCFGCGAGPQSGSNSVTGLGPSLPTTGPIGDVLCDPTGCGGGGGGGSSTCVAGTFYYAGYNAVNPAKPPVRSYTSAILGEYQGSVVNGGTIAGWVGVASAARDSHGPLNWIQAGLDREGTGDSLHLYIEDRINGTWPASHEFPLGTPGPAAEESTQYWFQIVHNSSSSWTANIKTYPGMVLLYSVTKSVSVDQAQITGESYAGGVPGTAVSCNPMEFAFWGTYNAGTWPTGQPRDGDTSTTDSAGHTPYWVGGGTNGNDFQSNGGF